MNILVSSLLGVAVAWMCLSAPTADVAVADRLAQPIQPDPSVPLVVRTVNVYQAGAPPDYPSFAERLRGIAKTFHTSSPDQIGLIGMQEAGYGSVAAGDAKWAAEYLARQLTELHQSSTAAAGQQTGSRKRDTNVGFVTGGEWSVLHRADWTLNWDLGWMTCTGDRKMIRALLVHRTTGYRLRFYSSHLTSKGSELLNPCNPSPQKKRERQAKFIIDKIRKEAEPGELPPIVVGDFNAGRKYSTGELPEQSVILMEAHFWRPLDALHNRVPGDPATEEMLRRLRELLGRRDSIDQFRRKCDQLHEEGSEGWERCNERADDMLAHWTATYGAELNDLRERLGPDTGIHQVYVGKKTSFPQSARSYVTLQRLRVFLHPDGVKLSDHAYSEGFRLAVPQPWPGPRPPVSGRWRLHG